MKSFAGLHRTANWFVNIFREVGTWLRGAAHVSPCKIVCAIKHCLLRHLWPLTWLFWRDSLVVRTQSWPVDQNVVTRLWFSKIGNGPIRLRNVSLKFERDLSEVIISNDQIYPNVVRVTNNRNFTVLPDISDMRSMRNVYTYNVRRYIVFQKSNLLQCNTIQCNHGA